MRSFGSPLASRLIGASFFAVTCISASLVGCSDDGIRTSGRPRGTGATGGDGSSGSSSAGTGSPGGSDNPSGGTGTAGTDPASGGTGPSAGTGTGAGGSGTAGDTSGVGGSAASTGGDAAAGTSSAGASAASSGAGGTGPCQMASYTFAPKIPTVFMLVDQSGSMFDCQNGGAKDPSGAECANRDDTSWYPLREGALQVIQALQAEVRFGFAPLGGTQSTGCAIPESVLPAFNNYDAIAARYNGLMAILNGETPVSMALDAVRDVLLADDSPGDRFILFVTDGEPDYCNNGDGLCPTDSAVYRLEKMYAEGIQTLVFGMPAPGTLQPNAPSILSAFANAGAGQPAVRPGNYSATQLYDECNFKPQWADDLTESGKPAERGSELGTYSAAAGTGVVYSPEGTNQQELVDLLSTALSNVKSCTFDLSNVNGQSIKVDLNKLGEASVAIEEMTVPQDATNGWSMMSQTQLVLNGTACDTWRAPESEDIDFNFPCNTIIFE